MGLLRNYRRSVAKVVDAVGVTLFLDVVFHHVAPANSLSKGRDQRPYSAFIGLSQVLGVVLIPCGWDQHFWMDVDAARKVPRPNVAAGDKSRCKRRNTFIKRYIWNIMANVTCDLYHEVIKSLCVL